MKLSQLKDAFAPLSQIGIVRKTISIQGVEVTLKTLNSKEEADVQKAISDSDEGDDISAIEYVTLFRKHTLAHAVRGVNGVSFEDAYIETGETLENGTPVKIPRVEALIELLDSLTTNVLAEMFKELASLTEKASGDVEKNVDTTTESLEEKEKILTQQLEETKQQKSVHGLAQIHDDSVKSNYSDALKDMG